MLKPSMVWSQQTMENSQTVLKRSEYQNTLPACWEICMQVKKQQLGASRRTSQNCGQQKGSTQGPSLGCDILPFNLGTQGPPEHCLGSDWDLWLWTHVCLHQPVIRPPWISQGSDLQRRVLRGSLNWLDLAGCWESKKSMRGITTEKLRRDQALSLCSGSTDSKTPDYRELTLGGIK